MTNEQIRNEIEMHKAEIQTLERELERWPKKGDCFFVINSEGRVTADIFSDLEIDKNRNVFGNIFRTKTEALAASEKIKKLLHGENDYGWIKTADRLPTLADTDKDGDVVCWKKESNAMGFQNYETINTIDYPYWKPLRKPEGIV